jgi:hypothetical protein
VAVVFGLFTMSMTATLSFLAVLFQAVYTASVVIVSQLEARDVVAATKDS